jgi:hypothetical protein
MTEHTGIYSTTGFDVLGALVRRLSPWRVSDDLLTLFRAALLCGATLKLTLARSISLAPS